MRSISNRILYDVGVAEDGSKKETFQRGMDLKGRITLLAEGCRGSLSEDIIRDCKLREKVQAQHQTYALGIKEVSIGLVVTLNYHNPYLNPYEEFLKLKHHSAIKPILEGGTVLQYGARTLNEGGLQAASLHSIAQYPKSDGILSFDVPTSLYRSNTNHVHDQPAHLSAKRS